MSVLKKILDSINDRTLILRSIKVDEVVAKNDGEHDIEYNLDFEYKIVENKNGIVNLKVKSEAYFEPEMVLKALMEFNLYYDIDGEVSDDEIYGNIEELLSPIGSEVSCLLALITKSMSGTPLILPPVIKEIRMVE